MIPRMVCDACDVLWTDTGHLSCCWNCGLPGRQTGNWELRPAGVHVHAMSSTYTMVHGQTWPIPDELEVALW